MMNNRKVYSSLFIYFLMSGIIFAQPKLNVQLGGGFFNPKFIGLDPDSNTVLPSGSLLSKNLLLNWGVRYQIYHNNYQKYTCLLSYFLSVLNLFIFEWTILILFNFFKLIISLIYLY